MKKIIITIVGIVGLIFIGIGVMTTSLFSNDQVVIPKEISEKKSALNNRYQQEVIMNIERSLQEGYQVPQGTSTVQASIFLKSDNTDSDQYKSCDGEVNFTNQNGLIRYQLNTKCKKDTGNLHINYTVTDIKEQTLSSATTYKVSDGYIIIGTTDENDSTDQYTANSIILKFDQDHNLVFSKKISDVTVENMNNQSYIEIRDILEDEDGYYLLGEVQNASGGDLSNLIAEMTKIYVDHSIEKKENNFSFLLKYDKVGNLVTEKLINPIEGDISVNKIVGKKDQTIFITSDSRIIQYNTVNDKFKYYDLPNTQIETEYLDQDYIYGYSRKCNMETEKNTENKDAIIKLSLTGKKIWQQALDSEEILEKNKCSDLIENVYPVEKGPVLVSNQGRTLSVYDEAGKNIKNIDYSPLISRKKERIRIHDIRQNKNGIEIYLENDSHIIVDTLDENYQWKNRYAVNIEGATELLDNTGDVDNIIPTESGMIHNKILKKENGLSILKVEYHKE